MREKISKKNNAGKKMTHTNYSEDTWKEKAKEWQEKAKKFFILKENFIEKCEHKKAEKQRL